MGDQIVNDESQTNSFESLVIDTNNVDTLIRKFGISNFRIANCVG